MLQYSVRAQKNTMILFVSHDEFQSEEMDKQQFYDLAYRSLQWHFKFITDFEVAWEQQGFEVKFSHMVVS